MQPTRPTTRAVRYDFHPIEAVNMVDATCAACGNKTRLAETALGEKVVNCSKCGAPVAVNAPGKATPPPIPRRDSAIGLADLPAPKRPSALGGAEPSKAAPPRSPLADADLPTPRGANPRVSASMPAVDLGLDLPTPRSGKPREVTDLPVPRPGPPELPTAKSTGHVDLPTPKLSQPISLRHATDLPTPKAGVLDLPTPRAQQPISDLPTPRAHQPISDLPTPRAHQPISDLPTPRAQQPISDLPTPKHAAVSDLPTPRTAPALVDLPTPKGPPPRNFAPPPPLPGRGSAPGSPLTSSPGVVDLAPALSLEDDDLLAPRGEAASYGGMDLAPPALNLAGDPDLDLPAPQGFFDDLPQPARAPTSDLELGFAGGNLNNSPKMSDRLTAPDPGLFDDLGGAGGSFPSPKGFFDGGSADAAAEPNRRDDSGLFDDLPQPRSLIAAPIPLPTPPLDLGSDLDLAPQPHARGSTFDSLELSRPSIPTRMDRSQPLARQSGAGDVVDGGTLTAKRNESLDLAEVPSSDVRKKAAETAIATAQLARKDQAAERVPPPRSRMIALSGLLVVVLGGGGYLGYQRFIATPDGVDVSGILAEARAAIAADDAGHWDRALGAARRVIQHEPKNAEALAIGAEAGFASALASGIDGQAKIGAARTMLTSALSDAVAGPQLQRAQALAAIASGSAGDAVERLKVLVAAEPKNAAQLLYLGWAQAALGDHKTAIATFDQVQAVGNGELKLHALYGRAQSKLAAGELDGARADFTAVYQLDKTHVGAQVGLAAALPAAQAQQQEQELEAIVARKDLASADPRAVALAWNMAGDAAKRGNRLDVARERYRKAIAISEGDIRALTGLAEVELLDGKLEAATTELARAVAIAKDDLHVQLIQAQLAIAQSNLDDAGTLINALLARTPAPSGAMQSRIKLLSGKLQEARGEDNEALKSFEESAQLAGDADLAPTLTAVAKLTSMADAATAAKDPVRATELRGRADALLTKLAAAAETDPQLALTVGMAHLQAGAPAKAEPWLRKVTTARDSDPDGHFQLGMALLGLDNASAATAELEKALSLAPTRADIGAALGLTFERANRDSDAEELYSRLLKSPAGNSIELRARAGKFYAKKGNLVQAAEQADKILAAQPNHPVGLYLKAEGLLIADKLEEARALFSKAAETERDPLFLDGLGRAAEKQGTRDGDTRMLDTAIRAYQEATERDPKLYNSLAGLGRLYLARREAEKAVEPLAAAYRIRKTAEVAQNLGLVYTMTQQPPAAIQWFKESLRLAPSAEASWQLGQLYYDSNQGKASAAALDVATSEALAAERSGAKAPTWLIEALYLRGRVHKDLNNRAAARQAWEQFLARNPPAGTRVNEVRRALATSLLP